MSAAIRFLAARSLPNPLRALILVALTAIGLVAMHSAIGGTPVAASSTAAHEHAGMIHDAGGAPADPSDHHSLLIMSCVLGMLLLTILFALAIGGYGQPLTRLSWAWSQACVSVLRRPPKPSLIQLCISRT